MLRGQVKYMTPNNKKTYLFNYVHLLARQSSTVNNGSLHIILAMFYRFKYGACTSFTS
jgi:hypothetical protein